MVFILGWAVILPPDQASAQSAISLINLPIPGAMVTPTAAFAPSTLEGIKVFPDNPLRFDFIVDTGDTELKGDNLKKEAEKLIKYFLASLTVPEKELWVNLSPYEKDRIIPDKFGITEMGRDLLAQDYILKQLTASLMYPEDDLGKKFWNQIYRKAYEQYGTTDISINTFNKVWIVPQKAVVYENAETNTAFVVESHLKVMLEKDYLAMENNKINRGGLIHLPILKGQYSDQNIGTEIIHEIILPAIEKEVNEGKNFAKLRQIYHSLILAAWFKQNLRQSLLGRIYVGENKVEGVDVGDKKAKEKIYQQYLEAFKTGVYNYIKEDYDPATQKIVPRKYFSGGTAVGNIGAILEFSDLRQLTGDILTPNKKKMISVLLNPEFSGQGGAKIGKQIIKVIDFVKNNISQAITNDNAYQDAPRAASSVLWTRKVKAKEKQLGLQAFIKEYEGGYIDKTISEIAKELGYSVSYITSIVIAKRIETKKPENSIKQSERRLWLAKHLRENRNGKSPYTIMELVEKSGASVNVVRQAVEDYNMSTAEKGSEKISTSSPVVVKAVGFKRDTSHDPTKRINQDYGYADQKKGLILVSDAASGRPFGKEASEMVATTIIEFFKNINIDEIMDIEEGKRVVEKAVLKADHELIDYQKGIYDREGMMATLSFGFVWQDAKGQLFFIGANIGDSQLDLYDKQNKIFEQLSQDDVDSKTKDINDAIAFSRTERKGLDYEFKTDPKTKLKEHQFIIHEISSEAILFAWTDGLKRIKHQKIKELIEENPDPSDLVEALIAEAKRTGVKDDMTVSVLSISEEKDNISTKVREPEPSPNSSDKVGGIDLNLVNFNIEMKGEGIEFDLPFDARKLENLSVTGFTPIIFNVIPVTNLPFLLGLRQ